MFVYIPGLWWVGCLILLTAPAAIIKNLVDRRRKRARQEEEQARRDRFMKELKLSMEESEREDYRRFYED